MKIFLVYAFSLVVFIILTSCDKLSTLIMPSETTSEPSGPDITTKIVDNKIIPDNISGFKIGMSKDQMLAIAAKKKLVKESEHEDKQSNSSSTTFKDVTFLGYQGIMTLVSSLTRDKVEVVSFSVKEADTATLDHIVEELAKHFSPPRIGDNDKEKVIRYWSYSIGNYIMATLSSGTITIRFVFDKS